jgi:hypothetical protein
MGHPSTPSSPSSLLSLCLPPISSTQRAPPARHDREESIVLRPTDRRDLLVLPRLASRQCPSPAISLAKVASDVGEINRSPQSCIHLYSRVMCTLPEAPHRFVDSSGLRQATCGRRWSTASTTLSGTRPSVLCPVLTPHTRPFFLVPQNTKTPASAFFRTCPRSGKRLPESGTMPAKTRLLRIAATLNWRYLQLHISSN